MLNGAGGWSPSSNQLSLPPPPPRLLPKLPPPLTKVDEIVVPSGDNSKVTSEVNRLLAELPASVHALTGVDLSKVGVSPSAVGSRAESGGGLSQGLMASPILADTADQEGHRCTGEVSSAHTLQQPPPPPSAPVFLIPQGQRNVTDSGALFCRDQKCCVFRPLWLSSLPLSLSPPSPSHSPSAFHCHDCLVCLLHPYLLYISSFVCLFSPSLLALSTHIM